MRHAGFDLVKTIHEITPFLMKLEDVEEIASLGVDITTITRGSSARRSSTRGLKETKVEFDNARKESAINEQARAYEPARSQSTGHETTNRDFN
jgi:uncharacterized protein (DUF111 family)